MHREGDEDACGHGGEWVVRMHRCGHRHHCHTVTAVVVPTVTLSPRQLPL
jgi:hypothetical protein